MFGREVFLPTPCFEKLTCVLGTDRGSVLAPWTRWLPSSTISPSLSLPGPPSPFLLSSHPPHPPALQKHLLSWLPQLWLPGWRRRAVCVRGSERRPGSRRCSAEDAEGAACIGIGGADDSGTLTSSTPGSGAHWEYFRSSSGDEMVQ